MAAGAGGDIDAGWLAHHVFMACIAKKDTIGKFNIGYAPPYNDERHRGRTLIAGFFPLFEMDYGAFNVFSDGGWVRLLNDGTVKGYGYYCRQIDFIRKDLFSRNKRGTSEIFSKHADEMGVD